MMFDEMFDAFAAALLQKLEINFYLLNYFDKEASSNDVRNPELFHNKITS